jgi:protein-S-isoprenylcysteine O-methyltransferase Ste14
MFPLLAFMYVRLARSEEREALERFGCLYREYMNDVPGFFPRLRARAGGSRHSTSSQ